MRILQISCSYFPDRIGGTEVYVHNLSREFLLRGHQVFISYVDTFYERNGPRARIREYVFEGLPIFVIEKNTFGLKTSQLYFEEEGKIRTLFKDYLKKIQPDIVHFHHFSPTDVISQMKAAKELRLPIIFTYHTPMMTCAHQDMLYLGKRPCDGKIEDKKCLICAQTKYNIPFFLAWLWANVPESIAESLGKFISYVQIKSRLATWLQLPWLSRERIKRWKIGLNKVDHFVAVCKWVHALLLKNDIPPGKITVCRQGFGQMPPLIKKEKGNILRLGYIGRIHPLKGIDILLKAFRLLPQHYRIELCIYGVSTENRSDQRYYHKLKKQPEKDRRIRWNGLLSEEEKFQALSQLDLLVIPSRWLETGPLVLLEAWQVGTPVIAAKLGGIAELVNAGEGGLLFETGDAAGLARMIRRVYAEPHLLKKLRENIPGLRAVKEVADDMENLYRGLT